MEFYTGGHMDINRILLTGVAETDAVLTTLPNSNTPMSYFTLRVEERFHGKKVHLSIRPNYFRIETLGRHAEDVYTKVKMGGRYFVDGYLRQENSSKNRTDIVKVRSYGVVPDHSHESYNYKKGLRKALDIINSSLDLPDAITSLRRILEE